MHRVSFVLLLACVVALRVSADEPRAEFPRDLWRAELDFGPARKGELQVKQEAQGWRATLTGHSVSGRPLANEEMTFTWPDQSGELRLKMNGSEVAHCFWVQPRSVMQGAMFATPVRLQRAGESWHGEVQPLHDQCTLFLAFETTSDGGTTASMRNPEANRHGGAAYRVSREGEQWVFQHPRRAKDRFTARADGVALVVTLPDFDVPVRFERADERSAVGFRPRVPEGAPAGLTVPRDLGDGWRVGAAGDQSVSMEKLGALVAQLAQEDPLHATIGPIHSLLIARHGVLVVEEYFYGFDASRTHDLRSSSKTFAPMLAGIAGLSPGARVLAAFPDYAPIANLDPRKERIELRHLMSMTAGLAANENDDDSPGSEDTMQNQTAQPDWYRFTANLPQLSEPGGAHAVYSSGVMNLAAGMVRRKIGRPLLDYFDEVVARPLQFGMYHVNLAPLGDAYFGGGMQLRPRDALKLAQVYLDGGRWNGRQIVSADWARESLVPRGEFEPGHAYGYGWHVRTLHVGGRDYRYCAAEGNGGQLVVLLPDLDAAIAITGGAYNNYPQWIKWVQKIFPEAIVPALLP